MSTDPAPLTPEDEETRQQEQLDRFLDAAETHPPVPLPDPPFSIPDHADPGDN